MNFGRCRPHHCKIIKHSDDIVIHVHSKYKLFHQRVRGLSHMCELIHTYKGEPQNSNPNLPPWAPDYKPKPSEYDLAILSNCNSYFLENFIMWKAAVARLKNRKRMREQKRKSALQRLVRMYLHNSVHRYVQQDKEDKENTPPADAAPEDDYVPSEYSGPESDEEDADNQVAGAQDEQAEPAMDEEGAEEEVVEEETIWEENTIYNLSVQQQLLPEEPAWQYSRYEPISNQNYWNNYGIPPHYTVAAQRPIAAVSPSKPERPARLALGHGIGDVLGTMLPSPPSPMINVVDDEDEDENESGSSKN